MYDLASHNFIIIRANSIRNINLARGYSKDPGSGWSRDIRQNPFFNGGGCGSFKLHAST